MNNYLIADVINKIKTDHDQKPEIETILKWDRAAKKDESSSARIIMYHNCTTGKTSEILAEIVTPGKIFKIFPRDSKDISRSLYTAKEIETQEGKTQVLMLQIFYLSTRKILPGETRDWKETFRLYFTKEKLVITSYNQCNIHSKYCLTYYTPSSQMESRYVNSSNIYELDAETKKEYDFLIAAGYDFSDDLKILEELSNNFKTECNKVYPPIVTMGGNTVMELERPYEFDCFMNYNEVLKKETTGQEKIDFYNQCEMDEVNIPDYENLLTDIEGDSAPNFYYYFRQKIMSFATISKVYIPSGKNCCCLRVFVVNSDNLKIEIARLFVEEKKKPVMCKLNNLGDYVQTTMRLNPRHWKYKMLDFDKEIVKGTTLEYFSSIINEVEEQIRSSLIYLFLKEPLTEQLYKIGLKQIILALVDVDYSINPISTLETKIGKINKKGKNIYEILGINKFQFKYLLENQIIPHEKTDCYWQKEWQYVPTTLRHVKEIFGENIPLSSIDDHSFNTIVDLINFQEDYKGLTTEEKEKYLEEHPKTKYIQSEYSNNNYMPFVLKNIIELYSLSTAVALADKIKLLYKTYRWEVRPYYGYYGYGTDHDREQATYYNYIRDYCDYLDMVKQIPNGTQTFSAQFDNIEVEIPEMHDAAILLFNQEREKIDEANWSKHYKKWSKWEYEGEIYSVIYPRLANELALEGLKLGHCVRGYIERVKNGQTNILFIRQNNDIETPFFTVEISDNGKVEQIHGAHNCNLSDENVQIKNPDLEPFVNEWIKNKKLKAHNYNKVR